MKTNISQFRKRSIKTYHHFCRFHEIGLVILFRLRPGRLFFLVQQFSELCPKMHIQSFYISFQYVLLTIFSQ